MKSKKEICTECGKSMILKKLNLRGILALGYECSGCKDKIFTSEQANVALSLLQQKKLKDSYKKKLVTIGNSVGVIFPKDIVDVFELDPKKTKIDFKMDKVNGKITITVL